MKAHDAQQPPQTPLHHIGEQGLIEKLRKRFAGQKTAAIQQGIGDDAAVISAGKTCWLFSTDMLIEGIHFDLSYMPLQHLGYKAVAVNVSDIAAMNGTAAYVMVSIALSNRFSVEAVEALYEGIEEACTHYGVALIGGDTCSSRQGLSLSISITGHASAAAVTYRSGAQDGDLICLTGTMGTSYMGLEILKQGKENFLKDPQHQPDVRAYAALIKRQLKPEARIDIPALFAQEQIQPHAMIDTSDGLSSDLTQLCRASNIGADIMEEKLPIQALMDTAAQSLGLDPLHCALHGGEDYQLLFTIREDMYQKIATEKDISVIGRITKEHSDIYLLKKDKSMLPLNPQGWKSF